MRELDALQKQQNRNNFNCQGAGKLTGLGVLLHNSQCCSALLAHARPTMFYIPPSISVPGEWIGCNQCGCRGTPDTSNTASESSGSSNNCRIVGWLWLRASQ